MAVQTLFLIFFVGLRQAFDTVQYLYASTVKANRVGIVLLYPFEDEESDQIMKFLKALELGYYNYFYFIVYQKAIPKTTLQPLDEKILLSNDF